MIRLDDSLFTIQFPRTEKVKAKILENKIKVFEQDLGKNESNREWKY